jgi:hypothetical protein
MICTRSAHNFIDMAANMFTIERSLAMLEVIENQDRVDRCHNAAHGETSGYQNALIVLLSRSAAFEGSLKLATVIKKFGMFKSLWERILDLQVKP